MIDFSRSKQSTREMNLIPMIDMVFFLIVFFLVTGTVEKFDVIPLEIPVADSGKILDEGHIVIVLGQYDEVILNDELTDIQSLKGQVQALLESNPRKIISLKADARIEAKKMIDTMNLLREAGGTNLSLITQSMN